MASRKGKKIPRIPVSWGKVEVRVKRGKTVVKVKKDAVSSVTTAAATALGLKAFNATGSKSITKKTSSGATILNRTAAGTIRGRKLFVSIGERTPKGNLRWYQIPVPAGVSKARVVQVCKNVLYAKWQGGDKAAPAKGTAVRKTA